MSDFSQNRDDSTNFSEAARYQRLSPRPGHIRKDEVQLQTSLTSSLDGLNVQLNAPAGLIPEEITQVPIQRDWVGPTASLDLFENKTIGDSTPDYPFHSLVNYN